ncbi:MAG: hypothetical protein ACE5KZ_02675 [Candidatus Scalinduaceae bacterium]
MKPYKRYILISLLVMLILVIVLPCSLVVLVLERKPVVTSVQTINTDDAVRTRALVKKLIRDLQNSKDQPLTISATEDDINGVFSFTHRSVPGITGNVLITPELFEMLVAIKIPHNPVGDYMNVSFNIEPSASGLRIVRASLGRISIPGSIARYLIAFFLDLTFGYNQGGFLLASIDSVVLTDTSISVHMKPIPDLKQHEQEMRKRFKYVRDEVAIMGKPETVRVYYAKLKELSEKVPTNEPVSLTCFIGPLFKFARDRGGDPADENRAAILALGIYFGHWRVEQMIGHVRIGEMKMHRRQTNNVVLAGRVDLRLHFILSAVLEIASKRGITHAIGEFKELLDAGHGGSGFSFVDLAADRAGVRFAETATNSGTARRMQRLLGENLREDQFFPSIEGLPERLSKEVFEHYFGNVKSDIYVSLIHDIDTCIGQLPAYTDVRRETGLNDCNVVSVIPEDLL